MRRYDINLKHIKYKYDLLLKSIYKDNKVEIECYTLYKKLNRVNIDAKRHGEILLEIKKHFNKEDFTDAQMIEFLLQGMKRVEEVVDAFKKDARQYLVDNDIKLNHLSLLPLDKVNKAITPTKSITRYFEHAGKFVIACADEKSIYLNAGKLGDNGMMRIQENIFVFPTKEAVVVKNSHIFLNKPVYLYTFNANDFEPVVSVLQTSSGPLIMYDDEWISTHAQQVFSCEEIRDLTPLTDNYRFFMYNNSNVSKNRVTLISTSDGNKRHISKFLKDKLYGGEITYLNEELKKQKQLELNK